MTVLKIAAAALALSCSAAVAQSFPVTLTDDRPAEVTLETQPKRIVTLANYATDMAAALGIETLGVTTYSGERQIYLGDAANNGVDLGDITAPNLEIMAQLDPDLTIGELRYNAPYEEEIGALGGFLAYGSFSTEQSLRIVENLGQALGHAEKAQQMNADYMALWQDYAAKAEGQDGPSFVFIWYFQDTLYAFKDERMIVESMLKIGATNVTGSGGSDPENSFEILEPEQLLELDPEVIFMVVSHQGAVKHSPVYDRLQAVQNGRAWRVGSQFSQPTGPIARELVLREGAHLLYPELFAAPEMVEASRAQPLEFAR